MKRHDFLAEIHAKFRPRTYLEIGVDNGTSLGLSRAPSIAVDPSFKVTEELRCDLHLVRATSDDFFARRDPIRHFRSGRNPLRNLSRGRRALGHWLGTTVIDLAFIDGMHLFEFALRDYMNVERFIGPASIIVFDDIYPRNVDEAARERHTTNWTGDVYKVVPVLRRYRPDLVLLPMDTAPTGTLVVLCARSTDSTLASAYDKLTSELVVPDPQAVPKDVINRRDAVDPQVFLESPILDALRALRRRPSVSRRSLERIRGMAGALKAPR